MARGLVEVDVERDHEVELAQRARQPLAAGHREHGVAGERDERADLALARGLHLLGHGGRGEHAAELGQPADAAAVAARGRDGPTRRARPARSMAGRVNMAPPGRSKLPVTTLSASMSQLPTAPNSLVQTPTRPYATARLAPAKPRARARMVVASMPIAGATRSGAKRAAMAWSTESPRAARVDLRRVAEPLGEDHVEHGEEQRRVAAGADEVVLVGVGGRLGAARIDEHEAPAALAHALEAAAHVAERHHAAVGGRRGWRPGPGRSRCGRRRGW